MFGEELFSKQMKAILDLLGDQRAKDLTDRADSVSDSRERIAIFHRALRYGRTSLQAKKAYSGLGIAYEELGKLGLAIRNYTKAIMLCNVLETTPIYELYQRGRLYHQRGETEAARHDLEQALAIDVDKLNWLYRDERERAKRLLAEL